MTPNSAGTRSSAMRSWTAIAASAAIDGDVNTTLSCTASACPQRSSAVLVDRSEEHVVDPVAERRDVLVVAVEELIGADELERQKGDDSRGECLVAGREPVGELPRGMRVDAPGRWRDPASVHS